MGGYGTAQTRDAQQRTALRQLGQDEAQAFRQNTYDVNQQRAGQLGNLAALTRGTHATGTGTGTSQGTQTTTQSGGLLESILGAAAQVGSSYLTGGLAGKNKGGGGGGGTWANFSPPPISGGGWSG